MKYLIYLAALCATLDLCISQKVLPQEHVVGSIFNRELYPEFYQEEDDRRDYNKQELKAIEYLQSYNESRSFIAFLVPPKCDFSEWMYPSCCAMFEIMDRPHELCVDMALEWKHLTLSLAMTHNAEVLFSFEFVLGEICTSLPYLPKIGVCGHVYHIDYKPEPDLMMRACLTIKLKAIVDLLQVNFYCLDATKATSTQKWALQHTEAVVPPTHALFAVLIKKNGMVMEFNNPIPPELIDAMKKFMGAAIEKVKDYIMVVKNAVVKAWNAVATAATNVWNWCRSWFG